MLSAMARVLLETGFCAGAGGGAALRELPGQAATKAASPASVRYIPIPREAINTPPLRRAAQVANRMVRRLNTSIPMGIAKLGREDSNLQLPG